MELSHLETSVREVELATFMNEASWGSYQTSKATQRMEDKVLRHKLNTSLERTMKISNSLEY
jgi:hypothetical protein